jgi:putative ABC transport system ATP-binding protein
MTVSLPKKLYRFIREISFKKQVLLTFLSILCLPFFYIILEIPKMIINNALGHKAHDMIYFGQTFSKLEILLILSSLFLILIIFTGILKYFINACEITVSESAIKNLRSLLFKDLLLTSSYKQKRHTAEMVQLLTSEVDAIGNFVGESIYLPIREGGTLITLLIFMLVQNAWLGIAALVLYPIQAYIIPKLQKKINTLIQERIRQVRKFSIHVEETSNNLQEIKTNQLEKQFEGRALEFLNQIYDVKVKIAQLKFLAKSSTNFFSNFIPFLFYAIGGYFVLNGELTLGALVAVLAAHKELSSPWRELLNFYQRYEDVKTRYHTLKQRFSHLFIKTKAKNREYIPVITPTALHVEQALINESAEFNKMIPVFSFKMHFPKHVLLLLQKQERYLLGPFLAGLQIPLEGSILYESSHGFFHPQDILGSSIAYVGMNAAPLKGTLLRNITLSFEEVSAQNSAFNKMKEILKHVLLYQDVLKKGLYDTIETPLSSAHHSKILELRSFVAEHKQSSKSFESFDKSDFYYYLSLHENIRFGHISPKNFHETQKIYEDYLIELIHQHGYLKDFLDLGIEILSLYKQNRSHFLQKELEKNYTPDELDHLLQEIQNHTYSLTIPHEPLLKIVLSLVPAWYMIHLVSEDFIKKILHLREEFQLHLPKGLKNKIHFYLQEKYNPELTVHQNIFFGALHPTLPDAQIFIENVLKEGIEKFDLEDIIFDHGLHFEVSFNSTQLSYMQKQKLALARALYRNPSLLIIDQATALFDLNHQRQIIANLKDFMKDKSIIWIANHPRLSSHFKDIVVIHEGIIQEQGDYAQLLTQKGMLYHWLKIFN